MKFLATKIAGVIRVDIEPKTDSRGFFARLYCPEEFAQASVPFAPAQASLSRNTAKGTLRGLHFQAAPYAENKLVRVTRGAVFDVAVDLRPGSATYRQWVGATLTAEGGEALFVPEGCAHGFLTLEPETDVLYQIDRLYTPGYERGLRYDDPAVAVAWPAAPRVISDADKAWPLLEGEAF